MARRARIDYDESMKQMEVLFSLIGNRDPYTDDSDVKEYGPVLSLLQHRSFDRIYLFYSGSQYLERARTVEEIGKSLDEKMRFFLVSVDLESPVDYEEVFAKLKTTALGVVETIKHLSHRLSVLLDPGTPQMQTAWFLLVRSGLLPAELLQGVPPRFAGGSYKVKEVRLDRGVLPEVRITGERKADDTKRWFSLPVSTNIIGENPDFQEALQRSKRIAQYDISVLIRGDTGTGKGLVARFIHEASQRKDQPFVSLNCAAITASLVESELFGHAKGAFTGASTDRMGLFRSANGGTIFLDEVGDLPIDIQPKLLRVLEEHTLVPVGEDHPVTVNVRVLAATNRDLEKQIETGEFRRDLYERLNEATISLPPLRGRPEDIPLLIRHYLDDWNTSYHEDKHFDADATQLMLTYPWPGNVRELANAVRSMCALSNGSTIGPNLLPSGILSYFDRKNELTNADIMLPSDGLNLRAYLHQIEERFYRTAMERSGGNGEKAAKLLGLNGPAFRKAWKERFGNAIT